MALSALRLRQLLSFDQKTGLFTRLVRTTNAVNVGDIAGTLQTKKGYWQIMVDGKLYQAHRLAWLYVTGAWPDRQIDHINGDRRDNRWCNLREANNRFNSENRHGANKNSTTGYLGVMRNGSGFKAEIAVNGRRICLGTHRTPEQAHDEYIAAKRRLHAGCVI